MNRGESTPYPSPAAGWYAVFVLVLSTLFAYVDRQSLVLMVGPIRQELGITDTQISLLQGVAFAAIYAMAAVPMGRLVDRRKRTTLIAIAVTFWSLMTMACGLATSFTELFLARAGVGLGEAALMPATYSLIGDCFDPKHRGRALGVFGVGMTMGAGAGLLLGGVVLNLVRNATLVDVPFIGTVTPWHVVFFVSGAPGLLVSLIVLTVREPARQEQTRETATPDLRFLWAYIRKNATAYGPLFFAAWCTTAATGGVTAWSATVLIRNHQVAGGSAGVMLGAALTFFGAIVALVVGPTTDRWVREGRTGGRMRGLLYSVASAIVGLLLAAVSSDANLATIGYGMASGCGVACSMIVYSSTLDISPNQIRGQMSAICSVVLNFIGASSGPTFIAMVTDYVFHDDQMVSHSILLVCLPLLIVAFTMTLIGLKPYSRSRAALEANMTTASRTT